MNYYTRLKHGILPAAAVLLALSIAASGEPVPAGQAGPSTMMKKAVKYAVELRLPQEGLFAERETDLEFHVSDTSLDDPVQGAPPIVRAKVTARVTMPSMASMPAQSPSTHAEGVPGDYGVV